MLPSPPSSPPPPPLPDSSPPDSPLTSRLSTPPPPPALNHLDQLSSSPDTSSEEDSEESYYTSDSDSNSREEDGVVAAVRKPKVSTTSFYEVNHSPHLSNDEDREDGDDSKKKYIRRQSHDKEIHASRRKSHDKEIHSSRRKSHDKEIHSTRRKSHDREAHSSRRSSAGAATRVKKKRKKGSPRVTKYKDNKKTVRQHIKKGTVEDLTTFFTDRNTNAEEDERLSRISQTSLNNYNYGVGGSNQEDERLSRISQTSLNNYNYGVGGSNQEEQYMDYKHSEEKVDFIAASKVIQEKLLLSRNNSIPKSSANNKYGDDSVKIMNDKVHRNSKEELHNPAQTNNGPHINESVTKIISEISKSFEDELRHEQRKTEGERTNMTVGLQTNNERRVHESKHQQGWRQHNQTPFKLIMSRGSKSSSSDISRENSSDWVDKRTSKTENDINNIMALSETTIEPISKDNKRLSAITQAANSHTYTHSYKTDNDSNDLKLSRHSHSRGINNNHTLLSSGNDDNANKTGLDENFINDSHYNVYHTHQKTPDMRTTEILSESNSGQGVTMTSEFDSGVSEGKDGGKDDSHLWDSMSTSTNSVKDSDGHNLSKNDDSWIAVDVSPHINGLDSENVVVDATTKDVNIVNNVDGIVGIHDVNNESRQDDNNVFSSSQNTVSKSYIISSLERDSKEAVTKPLENTFITTERLNQPEHSANVNMQLLKNLQSQTREGSRPDLFAHSSRVWSGMRGDDDGDGERGGGGRMEGKGEGERDVAATTGDIQTNKRPVLLHSQTESQRNEHNNLESGGGDTTSVNSKTKNEGDDFLSILDDINIERDSTAYFARNRNRIKPVDIHSNFKVSESDTINKVISEQAISSESMNRKQSNKESVEKQNVNSVLYSQSHVSSSEIPNSPIDSDNNNKSVTGYSKSSIEEEIKELHRKLSPQSSLKETVTTKRSTSFDSSDSSNEPSSVSSRSNSVRSDDNKALNKENKVKNTRETVFDVDFFSSSNESQSKEEKEFSGNGILNEDKTEVDQISVICTTPESKNNEQVSIHQRRLAREEANSHTQGSYSFSNDIPADEKQTGAIITSKESFRSVRDKFQGEEGNEKSQRTSSFKNRRSLNLERRNSDTTKKWRQSGGEFSSWVWDDSINKSISGIEGQIENSSVQNSTHQVRTSVVSKKDSVVSSVTNHDSEIASHTNSGEIPNKETNNNEDNSKDNTMTAVVGKVSSFNIHRRATPHEEQARISTNQTGSNSSDVYLVQDNIGDVYAVQEINTSQPAVQTYDTSFDTSSSSQQISYHQPKQQGRSSSSSQQISYHQPVQQGQSSDLYVDGSGIHDSKAREVISAYLQSDSNSQGYNNQNNLVTQTHSQSYNTRDQSYNLNNSSSSISNNPHSIVVHQSGDMTGYAGNNGVNMSGRGFDNNLLNNSTVTIDTQMDGRVDTSQTWSSGNNEPYTIGRGAETGYNNSMVVTNLNTPNQKVYSSYSNSPSMNTSLDSQYNNAHNVNFMRGSQSIQSHQPLNVNVNQNHADVTPFRTTPVTVQTTTSAIVGEKVDMKIDFPIMEQPQVTTTAELAHSSSDEEYKKNYVIKNVMPKKSSLKTSRDYDTSLDSNSDIIYTKKESLIGDIVIGGKNRKTVIDNRSNTDHTSKTYVVSNDDRGRSKAKVSGKVKHHSPERFFKNAQLSLKQDNSRNASSDEDSTNKKYRTVTRVVLDSDDVNRAYSRSDSESPKSRYRVISPQSSQYQENSFSEDDQYYEVHSRHSEMDTGGKRRRYKVINSSHDVIDSGSVRAHSSPKPFKSHSKSFEDNHVTKFEHKTAPSQFRTLPSNSKRHKTVIQLDLGNNGITERGRSESELSEPSTRLYRTKSVDSLGSGLKVFQAHDTRESNKMWRTGRTRSVGSSTDESSSDLEGSGPYNLSQKLVNTSKQKRGNKTYVVKSTVDDHHRSHPPGWYTSTIDINEKHPERHHEQNYIVQNTNATNNNKSFSQSERFSQHVSDSSSSQAMEKTVYYVREAAQPTQIQIPIQASPDSGRGTEFFSSDGENESSKKKFERVERIYEVRTEPELPEQFLDDSVSTDMRVLRGKILIQNRMDESSHFEDEFEQNTNLFDNSFHLGKDNPLYSSDNDLMAALRREEEQEMSRHVTQDITYDQVDSMTHKYKTTANAEITKRPKKKQNLSTLLLSKLANVDSKDIRQTINVEHHNEEIIGDINFIHADGKKSGSHNTSNFDSVTENVELTLQQGKAFVIIKVIAERIIPTDLEFNIWRKSQAIVTRQIEIDLLANEQRRRFYHHVMETQGRPALEGGSGRGHMAGSKERELNSMETLQLFSKILDIADGQGEKDHTTMRTKQEMGQLPSSAADLLY